MRFSFAYITGDDEPAKLFTGGRFQEANDAAIVTADKGLAIGTEENGFSRPLNGPK